MDQLLKIFNLNITEENISIDEIFMHLFESWTKKRGSIVKYLVEIHGHFKEKTEAQEKIREVLISYIKTLLLDPSIVQQSKKINDMGVLVLVDTIVDNLNVGYESVLRVVDEISKDKTVCREIFVPIIFYISFLASKKNILQDFVKFSYALESIVSYDGIKKLFEEEYMWGLGKYSDDIICHRGYEDEDGFTPCFLDGLLEIFLYPKGDLFERADILYNKTAGDINVIGYEVFNNLDTLRRSIYDIILSIIVKNDKIKGNFIRYVIRTYEKNKGRNKISFDINKLISDGYAYNLCSLLGEFSKKIVKKELYDLVDVNFIEIMEIPDFYKIPDATRSFVTAIFYMKVEFYKLSYGVLLKNIEMLTREHEEIETYYQIRRMPRLKNMLSIIESKRSATALLLYSKAGVGRENDFIDFAINNIYSKKLDKYKDEHFEIILALKYILIEFNNSKVPESYLGFLEDLLNSENRNIHIKKRAVKILSEGSYYIHKSLFSSLVNYYNYIHKSEINFFERYHIRDFIIKIFKEDKNHNLGAMESTKQNIKFTNFVIGDLEYLLSTGLTAIMNIKKISKELEEEEDTKTIEKLKKNLSEEKRTATGSMLYIKKSLAIVSIIVLENKKICLVPEILSKFVNILNYNLKMIVGPRCSSLSLKNMQKYNFEPKSLLRSIIYIYLDMKCKRFIDCIVKEQLYFNINFFKRAFTISEEKFILSDTRLKELKEFIQKLEDAMKENTSIPEEVVPDNFLDPLTYAPMKDPVKLLTSNVTIDRSTFEIIMVGDGVDPFNRAPLDENMIIEDKELKEQIEAFYKDKK